METAPAGLMWVLLASAAFACLDGLRKHLALRLALTHLGLLLSAGMAVVFAAVVARASLPWPTAAYVVPGALALGTNLAGNLLFLLALRGGSVSAVVPLLALAPAAGALLGWLVLDETLAAAQWAGLALVPVGALALHATAETLRKPWRLPGLLLGSPGSVPMLGTALAWGAGTALDKAALRFTAPPMHALLQSAGMVLLLGVVVVPRQGALLWQGLRRNAGMMGLAMVTAALAVLAQFVALGLVPVGIMEAVKRSLGMASSVVVGRWIFGEAVHPLRVVAVAVMTGGVLLLVLER